MDGNVNYAKSLNTLCYGKFHTYFINYVFADEIMYYAYFLAASLNSMSFIMYLEDRAM
jgi:hypothetical protein